MQQSSILAATALIQTAHINILSNDQLTDIFSCCDLKLLGRVASVCKEWNTLIASNDNQITKNTLLKMSFSNASWRAAGIEIDEDDKQEFNDLSTVIETYKMWSQKFPFIGKKMELTCLIRQPKSFNLTSLGQLLKKHFPENEEGYRCANLPNDEIKRDTSRWICMTRQPLPSSQGKNLEEQTKIAEKYALKMPSVADAITCLFAESLSAGKNLLKDSQIRCLDTDQYGNFVTSFVEKGFIINNDMFCEAPIAVGILEVN